MGHALVIEANMAIGRGLKAQLGELGLSSCAHVWSMRQAADASEAVLPDLVILGETVVMDPAGASIEQLISGIGAPVIRVGAGMCEIDAGSGLRRIYPLQELAAALAMVTGRGREPQGPVQVGAAANLQDMAYAA